MQAGAQGTNPWPAPTFHQGTAKGGKPDESDEESLFVRGAYFGPMALATPGYGTLRRFKTK